MNDTLSLLFLGTDGFFFREPSSRIRLILGSHIIWRKRHMLAKLFVIRDAECASNRFNQLKN